MGFTSNARMTLASLYREAGRLPEAAEQYPLVVQDSHADEQAKRIAQEFLSSRSEPE